MRIAKLELGIFRIKISVLNCILNAVGLVLGEDSYPFLVYVVSLKVLCATVGSQFTA